MMLGTARNKIVWLVAIALLGVSTSSVADAKKCPTDSVRVGDICMDTYEASIWAVPDPTGVNAGLVKRLQKGKVTVADLTAAGATQLGIGSDDYPCADNANDCTAVFAVSAPGVTPSRYLTWFQASAACRNTNKRLLRSAEWQVGAMGTPDSDGADDGTTTCNTDIAANAVATGSRSACVSTVGAYDMVGNVWEWVADWMQGDMNPWSPNLFANTTGAAYGNDYIVGVNPAIGQAAAENMPAAIHRGGGFQSSTRAGVFAFAASVSPAKSSPSGDLGFRCGRNFGSF